jgi:hypothetical protein
MVVQDHNPTNIIERTPPIKHVMQSVVNGHHCKVTINRQSTWRMTTHSFKRRLQYVLAYHDSATNRAADITTVAIQPITDAHESFWIATAKYNTTHVEHVLCHRQVIPRHPIVNIITIRRLELLFDTFDCQIQHTCNGKLDCFYVVAIGCFIDAMALDDGR